MSDFQQAVNDYVFEWIAEEAEQTILYDSLLAGVIDYAKSLMKDVYKDQEYAFSEVASIVSNCVAQMQTDGLISVAELSCGSVIFHPSSNPMDVFQEWMVEIIHSSNVSLGYFHDKQANYLIDALNQICPGSFRGMRKGQVVYPVSERIYRDLVATLSGMPPTLSDLQNRIGTNVIIPASELYGFFDMIIEKLKGKELNEKLHSQQNPVGTGSNPVL